MLFEVKEATTSIAGDIWVVEAIDYDDGGKIYAVSFSGPGAEERAREYAAWKSVVGSAADSWRDLMLLDKLELAKSGYGDGWLARFSTYGRGIRIHETEDGGCWDRGLRRCCAPTIRQAIEEFLEEEVCRKS